MRNSNSFPLLHQVLTRKKSDQKSSAGSTKGSSGSGKPASGRVSPLTTKRALSDQGSTGQGHGAMKSLQSNLADDGALTGTSSEDLVLDNGSEGTDDVDGESSMRTKHAIEILHVKIQKTRDQIKKEQDNKESIVNEYLQLTTDKQPTARIKALFEKKNQKSGQNIVSLQRKLEATQARLNEVEAHGVTGHKQAKEVLRDVGQGLNTIVSKPKEFAHLIKNKFGSADNIAQIKLEDTGTAEVDSTGGKQQTLPAGFKYGSDEDERSSITSGSGLGAHSSPHSNTAHSTHGGGMSTALEPIKSEIRETRDFSQRNNDILVRLVEDIDEYKGSMQLEMCMLRGQLEEERYRVERLEEQLNDLTELHQHEMLNLKQDLASSEEKIEYRLDERTADLSDLVDSASTRILRLEQQQQQQQILSMEMVENATFRTIISKLINVLLALLAVLLVFVSTAASFLSPFVHNTSRLMLSLGVALLAWLIYQNFEYIEAAASYLYSFFTYPWT